MSENSPDAAKAWDDLWNAYSNTLERWNKAFESFQKASAEVQAQFKEVMDKAVKESSSETMQSFTENWQKAMNEAGVRAFKEFGDNWQKMLSSSNMEQIQTYGEMLNKFAQTWNDMWQKK